MIDENGAAPGIPGPGEPPNNGLSDQERTLLHSAHAVISLASARADDAAWCLPGPVPPWILAELDRACSRAFPPLDRYLTWNRASRPFRDGYDGLLDLWQECLAALPTDVADDQADPVNWAPFVGLLELEAGP